MRACGLRGIHNTDDDVAVGPLSPYSEQTIMIYWAAVFLVIALVAGVLGMGGIAGMSANIAWILFVVGVVMAVVFAVLGRTSKL
jgi:uncharacterized membrane protein YtjA (UPF0391 family)